MARYKIGYIIGSLARESINRKLAGALVHLAPESFECTEIPIRDLPLYNYDFDDNFPAPARAFKDAVLASDALLFVTPEYNRCIPGGLKNAIDWASRPYGSNAFTGKPTAIIGASPGGIGTALAQRTLRAILNYCDAPLLNAPETYIKFTPDLVNDKGEIGVPGTADFLRDFLVKFEDLIGRVRAGRS